MNIKHCKKCNSSNIKKNGKRDGNQRFLCIDCKYSWVIGNGIKTKNINSEKLFMQYVLDDLKYRQIEPTINFSKKSIQRLFDKAPFKKTIVIR